MVHKKALFLCNEWRLQLPYHLTYHETQRATSSKALILLNIPDGEKITLYFFGTGNFQAVSKRNSSDRGDERLITLYLLVEFFSADSQEASSLALISPGKFENLFYVFLFHTVQP